MTQPTIEVHVNGAPRQVQAGATLAELLRAVGAPEQGVAVEVNQAIVRRADHATRRVAAGDRIEVVSLVGGG